MPYGMNLQPSSGVPRGSTGRNGDRRTSRDQVPRPASQPPNYEHSVQEQESPIDCDTLVRFVQMCFNRLEGEERDKFLGQLASLLAAAEQHGLEGVVSKRRNAPYRSGSCRDWRKVRTTAWRDANRERWRSFARSLTF